MIPLLTTTFLWCMVSVQSPPGLHFDDSTSMYGKLISQDKNYYVADFSVYAKEYKFYGDYRHIEVAKNMCWDIRESK